MRNGNQLILNNGIEANACHIVDNNTVDVDLIHLNCFVDINPWKEKSNLHIKRIHKIISHLMNEIWYSTNKEDSLFYRPNDRIGILFNNYIAQFYGNGWYMEFFKYGEKYFRKMTEDAITHSDSLFFQKDYINLK